MNRRIVLLGRPAAGKGTQAALIKKYYGIPTVSTGAVLRNEKAVGSRLGEEAYRFTRDGKLFPDEIALRLAEKWIDGNGNEFVLDGFPRTVPQADGLSALLAQKKLSLGVAIVLKIDEETVRRRVLQRRVCEECGLVVAVGLDVPSAVSQCPKCMGALIRREDDTLDAIENRIIEYRTSTEPLNEYYRQRGLLVTVDSVCAPEVVFRQVSEIVETL